MAFILVGAGVGAALFGGLGLWLASWETALAEASGGSAAFLLAAGAIGGAVVGRAWRSVAPGRALAWAAKRGVTGLGDDAVSLLQRFIRSSGGWRTTAVVAGLVLEPVRGAVVNAAGGTHSELGQAVLDLPSPGLTVAALGYVVAALGVELARRGSSTGAAVLAPRRVEEYVNPFAQRLQRVAVLVAVALLVLGWAALGAGSVLPQGPYLVLAIAAMLIVVEVSQRVVVARSQRFSAPDVVIADDLARASTGHALTGGFVGLVGMLAGQIVTWNDALDAGGPVLTAFSFLFMIIHWGSLGLWAGLGTEYASTVARRVPRDRPSGAAATSATGAGEVGAGGVGA